jgi:glyoxylase-like metal-dependent hydrolase (beta-lactamase superfamily II)
MRVHHLNCATLCPRGGRRIGGRGGLMRESRLVCHVLLIETNQGLVLVDTGLGLQAIEAPRQRLGRTFLAVARPRLDPTESALRQVEWRGFRREDVRHIVLTHLDPDHAGGLADFPHARIHVFDAELQAATHRASAQEKERYRKVLWEHVPRFERYDVQGESWFGFEAVRELRGLPPEVLMIPLPGHTRGHSGVAVLGREGWVLHAGDAYFFQGEIHEAERRCPWGLEVYQRIVEVDPIARRHNQDRLRALAAAQAGAIRIVSSHDPEELERAVAASEPAEFSVPRALRGS